MAETGSRGEAELARRGRAPAVVRATALSISVFSLILFGALGGG
jgi:hypothetical protein